MTAARDRARALRRRDQPTPPHFQPPQEPPTSPPPSVPPETPAAQASPAAQVRQVGAGFRAHKKVRQTVDLPTDTHRGLATWRLSTAITLGRTRLSTQDVLHALVEVLLQDETVARLVRTHLEDEAAATIDTDNSPRACC